MKQLKSKTAYVDTSELMKEYTEAKDLEAKYKAKAEEKGKQLEAEINRFKKKLQLSSTSTSKRSSLGTAKVLNYKKETTIRHTSVISGTASRERKRNGFIRQRSQKFIKAYGKEKDMRTSTVQVTRLQFYTLKTNLISQKKSSKP
jgi:outer membrane protein